MLNAYCPLWSDLAGPDVASAASHHCWGYLTGPGHWSLGSTLGGSIVDVPISTSTALAPRDELFSASEQLVLAGFLAGYSGLTRDAYTLDLRQASPATSSPWAEPGPRSPAACAPWPASTATPNRKA
jgi:hypothetical protein